MMKNLNITIVGAGGGASYLLPQLIRLCHPIKRLTIYDADILEERNLDRQLFSPNMVGENKAEALIETMEVDGWFHDYAEDIVIKKEWFTPDTEIPDDESFIFSCADNHPARCSVLSAVDRQARRKLGDEIYECDTDKTCAAIILGNEFFESQAYIYFPMWKNGLMDPRMMYPELRTSTGGDPSSCQGVELESHPQLAIANARSADHALHLMYLWNTMYVPNTPDGVMEQEELDAIYYNLPINIRVGLWMQEYMTIKQLRKPRIVNPKHEHDTAVSI